ncbi:MAG TPA: ankyrin repeat domain-containing protein [Pirellulales bacterium]
MQFLATNDPLALAVVEAIRGGHIDTLKRLLADHPGLAQTSIGGEADGRKPQQSRTLLHIVTDWPGHFPRGAETVAILVTAGANVNAQFIGPHTETPLHWAASCDDVSVLDALLDRGADIEARGAVIAGGTALADATAFGQWKAARRLVERGAKTTLWEASALGLLERIETMFSTAVPPTEEITRCFWGACHGGQQETAQYLLDRGADINWIGWDELTPLDAAGRAGANSLVAWLYHRGAKSAKELRGV